MLGALETHISFDFYLSVFTFGLSRLISNPSYATSDQDQSLCKFVYSFLLVIDWELYYKPISLMRSTWSTKARAEVSHTVKEFSQRKHNGDT